VAEDVTSAILTVLALLAPVLAVLVLVALVVALVSAWRRVRGARHRPDRAA
jgi:membrane protein implicated in regulation of membrane protease activity